MHRVSFLLESRLLIQEKMTCRVDRVYGERMRVDPRRWPDTLK